MTNIDINAGIENCGGDIQQYYEVLGIICEYAEEKLMDIERYLKLGDYQNYIITVHSLKSNAATAGAMDLSELARKIEMSGREGRFEEIEKNNSCLVEKYKDFINELKEYLKKSEEKCVMERNAADVEKKKSQENMLQTDEYEYKQSFKEIIRCIKIKKYAAARDLLEVLEYFDLPGEIEEEVRDMEILADNGDWDRLCGELEAFI